jgi:hypothetical protein
MPWKIKEMLIGDRPSNLRGQKIEREESKKVNKHPKTQEFDRIAANGRPNLQRKAQSPFHVKARNSEGSQRW